MEISDIISEEFCSLSGFYTAEESEFMTQFLGNCFNTEMMCENGNFNMGIPSSSSSSLSSSSSSSSLSSALFWPSESLCFPSSITDNLHTDNFGSMSMGFPPNDQRNINIEHISQQISEAIEEESEKETLCDDHRNLQAKTVQEDEMKNSAKRCRSSQEIPRNTRNIKSKKIPKSPSTSNYCSSEDDSGASQEEDGNPKNNIALKSNGKSRSNRGPATDPQSVYARRRRERINERLRILQNLVPNGTKVDISTMLEEAVQYVKFLQLQIKLLSSDDLWMYAPIAYNGLNIGFDLQMTPSKQL